MSTPWKQGGTSLKTVFSYDKFGRKIKEASDAGSVTYVYSGKSITVTSSGGQTSTKTMDSQGNVISSSDIGGTINFTYKSNGYPGSTSNNSSTWNMTYDSYGRQISLTDPNSGTTSYRYNKFGEMTRQLDARGNIDSLTYDDLGRVATEVRKEVTKPYDLKTYYYDPSGKPGLLWKVEYPGGKEYYNYDTKGRLTSDSVSIDGSYYSTRYVYDSKSRIQRLTYPSGFAIKYNYTTFGYLDEVRRNDNNAPIWDATTMNSFGQYNKYQSGNGLYTTKTFDCLGMLRSIKTGTIQNLGYSFDEETGNLISRRDNINNLTEIFSYDNLGRLTEVSGPSPLTINFANNGNITSKTSVGDYTYGTKPHAVTSVTNPSGLISTNDQRITYTVFNKADSIIQNNYKYTLIYGHQNQRTRSKLLNGSGTLLKTVYYVGPYEKEVVGTIIKDIHYIYGGDGLAAILKRQSGTDTMYYVHKDHLGSLDKVTNSSGVVVQKTSFDAWGRRRNPDNWTYTSIPATIFSRGYTGHEHLDQFDLINMNGRMYDPLLGRFLNVDPVLANPFFTQDYNKYSYVLNNPLKYTDPSGYKKVADPYEEGPIQWYGGDNFGINPYRSGGFNNNNYWNASSAQTALLNSRNGGTWSEQDGIHYFKTSEEALIAGIIYNAKFNFWNNSAENSFSVAFQPPLIPISISGGQLDLMSFIHANFWRRIPKNVTIIWQIWSGPYNENNGVPFGFAEPDDIKNQNSCLTVSIPIELFFDDNCGLLYDCIDHEIVHLNDFASGRVFDWLKIYTWGDVKNIMDYKAYGRNQEYSNNSRNGKYDYSKQLRDAFNGLPKGFKY